MKPQEYLEQADPDFLMALHELARLADERNLQPIEMSRIVMQYFGVSPEYRLVKFNQPVTRPDFTIDPDWE